MSKFSLVSKVLAGLFTATTVIGCSSSENIMMPDLMEMQQNQIIDVNATATASDPIFVSFNNAYQMLYTENEAIGMKDPRNPDKYLLKLIDSAKQTLDGAFYDIDDEGAAQAFIRAKKRGVKIRILTDTDNMVDKDNPALPRKQIVEMKNAGIEIKEDKRSGIMHNKFLVVDNKVVWTGSMNLTSNAMYRDNNNSLRLESPELAADYNAEFKRLFEQNLLGPNPHEIPYPEVKLGSASIKLFFSPKGGTQNAVLQELQAAKKSIKFMTFSLTAPEVKDIVTAKKTQGLLVEGVLDECLSRGAYSLYKPFKAANIFVLRDGNQALLHHKVIMIDDQTVITGSFNYSASAENSNNENTLIIKSPAIANLYNNEYNRIKYSAKTHTNVPDYDNPACGSESKK